MYKILDMHTKCGCKGRRAQLLYLSEILSHNQENISPDKYDAYRDNLWAAITLKDVTMPSMFLRTGIASTQNVHPKAELKEEVSSL